MIIGSYLINTDYKVSSFDDSCITGEVCVKNVKLTMDSLPFFVYKASISSSTQIGIADIDRTRKYKFGDFCQCVKSTYRNKLLKTTLFDK